MIKIDIDWKWVNMTMWWEITFKVLINYHRRIRHKSVSNEGGIDEFEWWINKLFKYKIVLAKSPIIDLAAIYC